MEQKVRIKREFDPADLMRAFIGVRIDSILAILKALNVNENDKDWRFHFQGAPPPERVDSTPAPNSLFWKSRKTRPDDEGVGFQ
jgi:hypothetical protein